MTDTTAQVCEKCGVVRAGRKQKCPHCLAAYENAVQAPSRHGDDFYWVCIECTFKCRMCGFDVPLNHLDMDGAVLCARCGLEQAFQVVQWRKALEHAQNTGDLWMDGDIGESQCSARLETYGENDLVLVASPGYPRCENCHAQLEIAAEDGKTMTSCACGEKATFEIPVAAQTMMESLRALIAVEHRADRRAVKVEQGAAAIAVACPSCNAPLEANETSKFLTCSFCNTTSRIPDRTWFRISGKDPKADPMWLLFQGPAPRREELEKQKRHQDYDRKQQEEREQQLKERSRRHEQEERDSEKQKAEKERAVQEADAEIERVRREQDRSGTRNAILVIGGCLAVGIAITLLAQASKSKKSAPMSDLEIANSACASGDGKACMRAGDLTGTQYPATRRKSYELACNAGIASGCTKHGDLGGSDAADFYQRGCTGGDKPACDALDTLYAAGKATPKDPALAVQWAEKLCTSGKPSSCTSAGIAAQGKDDAKAFGFFHSACDGGEPRGCNRLGHLYETGTGTKKDLEAMLVSYQTACNRDQTWCYDLGRVYESGIGVQKNATKATALYTQACTDGNEQACAAVRK